MVINEAGGGGCGRPKCHDLTAYLALAMSAHGNDPRLQKIAESINPSMPPVMSLGSESLGLQYLGLTLGGGIGGYKRFNDLEASFKEWDIKRNIQRDLGDGIILCGETCDWYDYSTPGNIHFGYVAGRAGIDHEIAAVAGGLLEQWDLFVQEGKINLGYCNWTFKCDSPQDQAAVDFGYALAEKYSTGITPEDLKKELTVDKTNQFQRPISRYFHPPFPAHPQQTSYGPDDFNWTQSK